MGLPRKVITFYKKLHIYPKIFATSGLLIAFVFCLYVTAEILTIPERTHEGFITYLVILPFAVAIVGVIIFLPFLFCAVIVSIEKYKRSLFILLLSILISAILFKIYFLIFIYSVTSRQTGACGLLIMLPINETIFLLASWGIYKLIISIVALRRKIK